MMDVELISLLAARFKALADPGRLELLSTLFQGERSVGDLVASTGRHQPNVSQQLARLAQAGLVSPRRDGNRVLYRLADPYLEKICEVMCESVVSSDERAGIPRRGRRPGRDRRG